MSMVPAPSLLMCSGTSPAAGSSGSPGRKVGAIRAAGDPSSRWPWRPSRRELDEGGS